MDEDIPSLALTDAKLCIEYSEAVTREREARASREDGKPGDRAESRAMFQRGLGFPRR